MREDSQRTSRARPSWVSVLALFVSAGCGSGGTGAPSVDPIGHPGLASPNAQSIALSPTLPELYVTNTAADTLDIIDTETREVIRRVATGIDPVSVAVRPDGLEVWVSNHVSDSVSVIDADPQSDTRYRIIATIQTWDTERLITDFDEPVGIAFADNDKAYVALSSRNMLAVIDVRTRAVTKQIKIFAQEPRALRVRNGYLFVLPFESGNQTELSGCFSPVPIGDCTFNIIDQLLTNSIDAILTRNFVANIIRNPLVPDRDLFVFDTATDELVQEVSTIGTLLYGLTIDSTGRAFIALTEARNDANGLAGTLGHDLIDIENRMFLNQVATVDCADGACNAPELIELEVELPAQPAPGTQLATPFGIEISADDSTVVAVAASSSRLFTMDAVTGVVLGRAKVGAIPRALVLESDPSTGAPMRAWVHNAVGASVSLVDISNPAEPSELEKIILEDPTLPDVKAGRIAFNNAEGSTSGTFSCGSCHPDAHTDQLLWNLGARCETPGCDQAQPRSTMPIRGLKDTLPLHWDGIFGDPFGGINAVVADSGIDVPPNCTDEHSCFRHLVDGTMSGAMCDQADCPTNGEGLDGALTIEERDAMSVFLKSVPYPPTRSRRMDDQLSDQAWVGFKQFLIGTSEENPGCSRAGGCHMLPFWAGTNTPVQGMDAPTFRGIPDRHLLLPNGRAGMWELHSFSLVSEVNWNPANGPDELFSWGLTFGSPAIPLANRGSLNAGPFDLFQLFDEGSMGFSGAFGRQVTLDARTTAEDALAETLLLLDLLETAGDSGVIELRADGIRLDSVTAVSMVYDDGRYYTIDEDGMTKRPVSRDKLIASAQADELLVTLTGRMGANVDVDHPQPALWLPRDPDSTQFLQKIPEVTDTPSIELFGRHVVEGARILIDGLAVEGAVSCVAGTLPNCDGETLRLDLEAKPSLGDHTFQVTTPGGFTSNEVMLVVR